jgi:hypothetical protein
MIFGWNAKWESTFLLPARRRKNTYDNLGGHEARRQKGGASKSIAKQDAARKNGCFGGRPAKGKKAQDAMDKINLNRGVTKAIAKAKRQARGKLAG